MKRKFRKILSLTFAIVLFLSFATAVYAEEAIEEPAVVEEPHHVVSTPVVVVQPTPAPTQAPIEAPVVQPQEPAPTEIPVAQPQEPAPTEIPVAQPQEPAPTEVPAVEPQEPVSTEVPAGEPQEQDPTEAPAVEPQEQDPTQEPVDNGDEEPATEEIPTEEPTLEPTQEIVYTGSITIMLHGTVGGFQYGDTVTLEAFVSGFEGANYVITWEYSENGIDWFSAPGSNHDTIYQFQLTEQNAYYGWRAALDIA